MHHAEVHLTLSGGNRERSRQFFLSLAQPLKSTCPSGRNKRCDAVTHTLNHAMWQAFSPHQDPTRA